MSAVAIFQESRRRKGIPVHLLSVPLHLSFVCSQFCLFAFPREIEFCVHNGYQVKKYICMHRPISIIRSWGAFFKNTAFVGEVCFLILSP